MGVGFVFLSTLTDTQKELVFGNLKGGGGLHTAVERLSSMASYRLNTELSDWHKMRPKQQTPVEEGRSCLSPCRNLLICSPFSHGSIGHLESIFFCFSLGAKKKAVGGLGF